MAILTALMRYFLSICFLLSRLVLNAQEYREELYLAYIHDRMDRWKELMDQMELEYRRSSSPDILYTLLEAEYGYTGWLVEEKQKSEAEELLRKAEVHMVRLTELGLDDARVYSLKGAFYGFQILLEPARAPKLGRLSMEANDKAMELDQEEPQVWLEKANMEYFRPPVFGGSKRNAVPMYEKAVDLFESSPELIRQNWVYMNCLASLGIAYENTRKYSEAGSMYRKILNLEPSFERVKDELYPHFQEKHSGK